MNLQRIGDKVYIKKGNSSVNIKDIVAYGSGYSKSGETYIPFYKYSIKVPIKITYDENVNIEPQKFIKKNNSRKKYEATNDDIEQ